MRMSNENSNRPVVKAVSYFLVHVPSLVRYGSKPYREIIKDPSVLTSIISHLRSFDQAVRYPPNQVYIGSIDPDELGNLPYPWYQNLLTNASRRSPDGEIMPEEEFYCMMKISDEFELIMLEETFLEEAKAQWANHPLCMSGDLERLKKGFSLNQIKKALEKKDVLPLYIKGDKLVGCIKGAHEEDSNLTPEILLENLASRASGALALRHLVAKMGNSEKIDYILGCGEEAVGDRYNRGGGSLSKAIGELCGCMRATGSDVKAFCCAPVHAMVIGAGLVASNIFDNVIVVGGGSLAKLGMKFHGHLRHNMPILEDVLGAIAVWIGRDDGKSPFIRLDSIGKHQIDAGSAQQAILNKLVVEPLDRLGLKLKQIDKYATELHNPEITEPQGSGNVPLTNYRIIASFAYLRNEITKDEMEHFIETHGMKGFSPTQGHIASAVPYLGFAVNKIMTGEMTRVMFLAKGSLFLGRMTHLSDGISFILEKNKKDG